MTFGESQGKVAPPKFSPNSTMTIRPMRETLPAQSTALTPSTNLVLGLWTSRKSSRRAKATPQTGRFIQNIHLHDRYVEKIPPRTGPRPPATAQVTCRSPRKSGRVLQPGVNKRDWRFDWGISNLILNMSEMTTETREPTPPPEAPWRARAVMSIPILVDRAQIIEPTK